MKGRSVESAYVPMISLHPSPPHFFSHSLFSFDFYDSLSLYLSPLFLVFVFAASHQERDNVRLIFFLFFLIDACVSLSSFFVRPRKDALHYFYFNSCNVSACVYVCAKKQLMKVSTGRERMPTHRHHAESHNPKPTTFISLQLDLSRQWPHSPGTTSPHCFRQSQTEVASQLPKETLLESRFLGQHLRRGS